MTNLKSTQSNQKLRALRLSITVGLAMLFLAVLLWGLRGVMPVHADPGIPYVNGATGQDISTCGTVDVPCKTISYTLNSRASSGDTIRVAQGVYTENLTVDKPVTLEGGYVPSGTLWLTRTGETIIDGSNSRTVVGDWDGNGLGYPFVIKDGNSYEMWYTGRDLYGVWRVGYLTSTDGINWTRILTEPVLDVGSGDAWDSRLLEAPFIIKEGPTSYKMWYTGRGPDDYLRIGYATSTDGINWTKYAGNPVLDLGTDTWNNRYMHGPSIIQEDGLYKMWLHTAGENGGGWTSYMAYATSPSGITWTLAITNPLFSRDPAHYWESNWIWGPNVLHIGGSYRMWYSAWGSGASHTGYATSTNGIDWTKYNSGAEPVLSGTGGEWDEGAASDPCVLYASGVYTMWYDNGTSIGVATSTNGITWTKYAGNPVFTPGTPGQWGQPMVKFVSDSDGSVLGGFTVRNGEAEHGGGVFIDGAQVTVQNCVVTNNNARYGGGGIGVAWGADATISNTQVLSNSVSEHFGGGIFIVEAQADVRHCLVAYNRGAEWGGAGVVVDYYASATLLNNEIVSNTCPAGDGDGGGVRVNNHSSAEIRDNLVAYNQAGGGGGINVTDNSTVVITNNQILSNTADWAAGVNVNGSNATIGHNTVKWNAARGAGGIAIMGAPSASVYANIIAEIAQDPV